MGTSVLDEVHQVLFFLVARRCLDQDYGVSLISPNTLRKQLTLHTESFFPRPDVSRILSDLQKAGLIRAREPGPTLPGRRRAFSTLLFEITPLGLDYVDQLITEDDDQVEFEGGTS